MHATPTEEQIAGAAAYEELHVPALFGQWVETVLEAASVGPGQRVLDVACGTGVLARAAVGRVGEAGTVTGLDPDPGMLFVARQREPSVSWEVGRAESLPFPDGSFDAVVSQFGMMFFADRPGAAREMLRVLRGGGRFAVAVWDALENLPAYAAEVRILDEIGGREAGDALRAPFVLGDAEELAGLFRAAAAEEVEVTTRSGTARFPDIATMVGADLYGWLPVMGVELPEKANERILEAAEEALSGFTTPEGRVEFDASAHIVTGRKP